MNIFPKSPRSLTSALRYGPRLRPARDWFVLLALFFILLVASVAWNVVQFSRVADGEQIGNAQTATPKRVDLGTVQSVFDARAQERARYQGDYRFVDPSL